MLVLVICILTFLGVQVQPENKHDLRRVIVNPASATQEIEYQYRSDENYGPYNRARGIFVLQPKLFTKFEHLHWAHHLDFAVVEQPDALENKNSIGAGNILYRSYLSQGQDEDIWVYGAGPAIEIPTAPTEFGFTSVWAGGVSFVLLYQPSLFTAGAEATQLWGEDVSKIEVRPIVKIRVGSKTTIGFFDTIRMDWKDPEGDHLIFPVGAEFSQLFKGPSEEPVTVSFGAFGNVKRPDDTSDWYWRLSLNILNTR